MTHAQFIVALTLIILAACVAALFGIRWANRPAEPDPIEHGDGEP